MSRIIQFLLAAVLVLGGLQWFVPRWTGGLVARELARVDRGPRPVVAVQAMPFWELFSGRFGDVAVSAENARVEKLSIRRFQLNWRDGGLSLSGLEKGQVVVQRAGHLAMTAVITGPALSQWLAQQGSIAHPTVSLAPSGVSLKGDINLGGATVPLDTRGTLSVSGNQQALIFHPHSIDGLNLPVMTQVQLVNLSRLKLPMTLDIRQVRLGQNQLILTLGN